MACLAKERGINRTLQAVLWHVVQSLNELFDVGVETSVSWMTEFDSEFGPLDFRGWCLPIPDDICERGLEVSEAVLLLDTPYGNQ